MSQVVIFQVSTFFPIPPCLHMNHIFIISQKGYGDFSDFNAPVSYYASIKKKLDLKLDKIFDQHLSLRLLRAYKWLMREYHIGDKLFLFGTPPSDTCCKGFTC
jgi:Uncharacterized alpha/beta hydrolase domain (DUF2235)